jgi:hypothetical protein
MGEKIFRVWFFSIAADSSTISIAFAATTREATAD